MENFYKIQLVIRKIGLQKYILFNVVKQKKTRDGWILEKNL